VERWNQLSTDQKYEVTRSVGPAVLYELAKDMELPDPLIEFAVGGFKGETNPTMIVRFSGEMSFDLRREFSIAAGVLLRQNSVIAFDENDTTNGDQGFFIKLISTRPLSFEERADVFKAIYAAFPEAEGFTGANDALIFGDFTTLGNDEFLKRIEQILPQVVEGKDYGLTVSSRRFRSEYIYTEQTSTYNPLENTRYATTTRPNGGESNLEGPGTGGTLLSGRNSSFDTLQTFADQIFDEEVARILGSSVQRSAPVTTEYTFAKTTFDPGRATGFEFIGDPDSRTRRDNQTGGGMGENPPAQTNIGRDIARNSRTNVTEGAALTGDGRSFADFFSKVTGGWTESSPPSTHIGQLYRSGNRPGLFKRCGPNTEGTSTLTSQHPFRGSMKYRLLWAMR
jgi:hypothetical protein